MAAGEAGVAHRTGEAMLAATLAPAGLAAWPASHLRADSTGPAWQTHIAHASCEEVWQVHSACMHGGAQPPARLLTVALQARQPARRLQAGSGLQHAHCAGCKLVRQKGRTVREAQRSGDAAFERAGRAVRPAPPLPTATTHPPARSGPRP